jgi:hypothetical protein
MQCVGRQIHKINAVPENDFATSNPGGSGNRAALITVTANFSPSGGGSVQNLVNGATTNNTTDSIHFPNGGTNQEIIFQFLDAPKNINSVQFFFNSATSNGIWTFYVGDGNTWTQVGTSGGAISSANPAHSFTPPLNRIDCTHFRMLQTGGTTSSVPWFQEVWFEIADAR